jgi:hypothetical protein
MAKKLKLSAMNVLKSFQTYSQIYDLAKEKDIIDEIDEKGIGYFYRRYFRTPVIKSDEIKPGSCLENCVGGEITLDSNFFNLNYSPKGIRGNLNRIKLQLLGRLRNSAFNLVNLCHDPLTRGEKGFAALIHRAREMSCGDFTLDLQGEILENRGIFKAFYEENLDVDVYIARFQNLKSTDHQCFSIVGISPEESDLLKGQNVKKIFSTNKGVFEDQMYIVPPTHQFCCYSLYEHIGERFMITKDDMDIRILNPGKTAFTKIGSLSLPRMQIDNSFAYVISAHQYPLMGSTLWPVSTLNGPFWNDLNENEKEGSE